MHASYFFMCVLVQVRTWGPCHLCQLSSPLMDLWSMKCLHRVSRLKMALTRCVWARFNLYFWWRSCLWFWLCLRVAACFHLFSWARYNSSSPNRRSRLSKRCLAAMCQCSLRSLTNHVPKFSWQNSTLETMPLAESARSVSCSCWNKISKLTTGNWCVGMAASSSQREPRAIGRSLPSGSLVFLPAVIPREASIGRPFARKTRLFILAPWSCGNFSLLLRHQKMVIGSWVGCWMSICWRPQSLQSSTDSSVLIKFN